MHLMQHAICVRCACGLVYNKHYHLRKKTLFTGKKPMVSTYRMHLPFISNGRICTTVGFYSPFQELNFKNISIRPDERHTHKEIKNSLVIFTTFIFKLRILSKFWTNNLNINNLTTIFLSRDNIIFCDPLRLFKWVKTADSSLFLK